MELNNRYDFVMLFDVENGNPNGDPDAGNNPRIDAETGIGLVSDVCLKRKIRNYVELIKEGEPGYNILIKADRSLNDKFESAYSEQDLKLEGEGKNKNDVMKAQEYICKNYYDVRTFGAVMSTGKNPCGIVRGPVQINFGKSISPINIQEVAITRQAKTTKERLAEGDTEIGRKSLVPYGLYKAEGYVSAFLANKVGFSSEDLELLWQAIINMFENDHSAARGKMCLRKLYIFKHDNILGNCHSNKLFDLINIKENTDVPRKFSDYEITPDEQIIKDLPEGVELISKP
ncbi:MAG: type I-C CRISPR-associated protein Cas7/Csd2 [Acutalibacteraceae bacterium]